MTTSTTPCGYAESAVPYRLSIGDAIDPHPAAALGPLLDALRRGVTAELAHTGHTVAGRPEVRVVTRLTAGPQLPPGVWSALVLRVPVRCPGTH